MDSFLRIIQRTLEKKIPRRLWNWLAPHCLIPVGMPSWIKGISVEPSIQLAAKEIIRFGDTVFDVGAHYGELATVFSRLVGPRGVVCAFEANPTTAQRCQHNIVCNGCFNTYIHHAAVYHTTGATLSLYVQSGLNDTIVRPQESSSSTMSVTSLALDNYVERSGIVPRLVKFDIEGAEYDALQGFSSTINQHAPYVIVEVQDRAFEAVEFLQKHHYKTLDLNSYQVLLTKEDIPPQAQVRNVLCIPERHITSGEYRLPLSRRSSGTLVERDFLEKGKDAVVSQTCRLSPGLYVASVTFQFHEEEAAEVYCGLMKENQVILQYQGDVELIASSYFDWPFEINRECSVSVFVSLVRPGKGRVPRIAQVMFEQIMR